MAANDDSCSILQATHSIYSVPEAAALWCRVPKNRVQHELSRASPIGGSTALGRATLRHSSIPCLEVRIRAMHLAIDEGKLPACYENGKKNTDHIAYERRHVYGQDLKEWAGCLVPEERPVFLFGDMERQSHSTVTLDAFQVLQTERDALRVQRDKNAQERDDKDGIIRSLEAMLKQAGNQATANEETEVRRLQRALGALVIGLASEGGRWATGQAPNVSAMVTVALRGVSDESGNAPHGFGKTTLENTISSAVKACKGELSR